ncbi:hypothetical protein CDD83_8530 [Cordyceps sp. RAO-2017]|nr:hypothetical protein CDD83_8530 [Cordyceps sp. RAO-2017]
MAPPTKTTELRLASADGPVNRKVLDTPVRDASPSEIPIIDVSAIFSESLDERRAVAQQVRAAATNTGFFYIRNHGVPEPIQEDCHAAGLDFFRQDMETKMRADWSKSAVLDTCVADGTAEKKYPEIRCGDWFQKRLNDMLNLDEAEGF